MAQGPVVLATSDIAAALRLIARTKGWVDIRVVLSAAELEDAARDADHVFVDANLLSAPGGHPSAGTPGHWRVLHAHFESSVMLNLELLGLSRVSCWLHVARFVGLDYQREGHGRR